MYGIIVYLNISSYTLGGYFSSNRQQADVAGRKTMDIESYIQSLLVSNPLRESTIRAMLKVLQLPKGSRGLDAGCGIGLQSLLLAEEVGLIGHITGLDVSSEMLDRGQEIVKEAGLSERISFQEGDVTKLPFDDNTFDWVWNADCVGYGPWEPLPSLTLHTLASRM